MKARSLEAALFPDNVPQAVYDNLIRPSAAPCPPSIATTTCGGGR
jgi:hypothetical protein